ncbi:MAG: hypothetical protein HY561_12635 [Gemmatimonadetes bacterium]|nr:hypothetical protein [Gemmatimonadota bacterium]
MGDAATRRHGDTASERTPHAASPRPRVAASRRAGRVFRALGAYAATAGAVVLLGGALLGELLGPGSVRAVWWGAGVAYAIQLVAFGALLFAARRQQSFLLVWIAGTLLRFAAVLVFGFWLARAGTLPPAPLLGSLAGFLFALLLLEPVFFRRRGGE